MYTLKATTTKSPTQTQCNPSSLSVQQFYKTLMRTGNFGPGESKQGLVTYINMGETDHSGMSAPMVA